MKERFLRLLYRYILPYAGLMLVKALSSTYRIRIVDPDNERDVIEKRGRLIYAAWHQRFFAGITLLSKRKPITIMISQSRDGEFISHIVDLLGWLPVRGSSSKGGSQALQRLKELAHKGYKIAHIVDGPRGPFGTIKPGLIRIAQLTNTPIVPAVSSADKKWVFNSWDRFMVPKPFSRVLVRFGDAIHIPPELDDDEFEKKRSFVEQALKQLTEDTDNFWTKPDQIHDIFKGKEGAPSQWLQPGHRA